MKILEKLNFKINKSKTIKENADIFHLFILTETNKLSPNSGKVCIFCCDNILGFLGINEKTNFIINGFVEYKGKYKSYFDLWMDKYMPHDEIYLRNDIEIIKIKIENI